MYRALSDFNLRIPYTSLTDTVIMMYGMFLFLFKTLQFLNVLPSPYPPVAFLPPFYPPFLSSFLSFPPVYCKKKKVIESCWRV